MKIFCILIVAAIISITSFAQDVNHPTHGYRGFAEPGLGVGTDEADWSYTSFSATTIHGYQIIPQVFIGGGLGIHEYITTDTGEYDGNDYNDVVSVIPLFFDARFDFIPARVSPFVDMRLGYTLGDLEGLYLSPSVGVRLNKVSLSAAYLLARHVPG